MASGDVASFVVVTGGDSDVAPASCVVAIACSGQVEVGRAAAAASSDVAVASLAAGT